MSRFEKLGRRIADVQDAERQILRTTERSAEKFIHSLRRKQPRQRAPLLFAAALCVAAAVPALAWTLVLRDARPPVQSRSAAFSVGPSIVVPRDHSIPLRFPDGSQVLLESGTRATVPESSVHEANVDIERGKAQFSVLHRAETRWSVSAGPYRVRVTGTKFDLEWSPDADRFALKLTEGSVVVSRNDGSQPAVKMVAPEHLVIDHGLWQMTPSENEAPASTTVKTPARPSATRTQKRATPIVPPRTPAATPRADDWLTLGKQGKFAEAHAQAEVPGIEQLSRTAAPAELLALAEICRFSGHPSQGTSVLTTLRDRFPDGDESAIAAFQLGRLSQSAPQAAEWFRTYLRERPQGPLARETAGRLLEALDRSGAQTAAAAAASYLKSYPSGPHAAFARKVLNGP